MRNLFLAGAGAIVLLALASPAAAASGAACLWDNLPSDKRERTLETYSTDLDAAFELSLFTDADFDAAARTCKISGQERTLKVATAMAGLEVERGSTRWLLAYGFTQEKLDAAWPKVSERVVGAAGRVGTPAADDAFDKATRRFAQLLGVSGELRKQQPRPPVMQYLFSYVMGRALREANDIDVAGPGNQI